MTLPCYQRHGYGRFLIEFSYLLSRKEGMAGTPEKPLSDLGKLSYQSYWKSTILSFIKEKSMITIEEISKATGMNVHDIASTLQTFSMISYKEEEAESKYDIEIEKKYLNLLEKQRLKVDEDCLRWTPLIAPSSISSQDGEEEDDEDDREGDDEYSHLDESKIKSGPVGPSLNSSKLNKTNGAESCSPTVLSERRKKRRRRWNKTGYDGIKKKKRKSEIKSNHFDENEEKVHRNYEINQDKDGCYEDGDDTKMTNSSTTFCSES